MWRELKDFITGGNVVGLAIAVVMGVAFGLVVTSFTNDVLMQIIAALGAEPNFSDLSITLRGTEVRYGAFLNAVINFLIVALTMFVVVKGYNRLARNRLAVPESEKELLRQIRDTLRDRSQRA